MDRFDVMAGVGMAMAAIGMGWIYAPLGLIVFGVGLIGFAIIGAKGTTNGLSDESTDKPA
jgi:uncharacterized membrane protein YidH (DUF202 family)